MPRKPANKSENTEKEINLSEKEKTLKKSATNTKNSTKKEPSTKAKSATAKEPSKGTKATTAKKSSTAKASTKSSTVAKKASSSNSKSKTATKKAVASEKTKSASKKASASKPAKSTSKKASASKATTRKSSAKKTTTRSKKASKEIDVDDITSSTDLTHKIEVLEYYDLPYRYNQTVVKVLAQTPTTLFIYWDISDADRANFVKQYGEDFFNYTKPVLVIHNNTMHYSFEIEIDDFANSWYLHVNDSNCEYTVELGRRPKYYNEERHINIANNYLYVTSSNVIDSPNDHVLFDKNLKTVYFKDVKTNIITVKDVTSVSFLRNMGRIYNLYDLQSDFNKNSWINSDHWQLDLKNPSSSNPSSTFK